MIEKMKCAREGAGRIFYYSGILTQLLRSEDISEEAADYRLPEVEPLYDVIVCNILEEIQGITMRWLI